MSDVFKIGIIFNQKTPQVLSEPMPANSPWRFEFIPGQEIGGSGAVPHREYLAVFFPCDESPGVRDQLGQMFPGAEILGYRQRDAGTGADPLSMEGGLPVLRLPMNPTLARQILSFYEAIHASRKEGALYRGRADDLQAFLDMFAGIVESIWNIPDRQPAMILLLSKIIRRLGAEEGLIYLCGDANPVPQRAYGTGHIHDIDLFDHKANSSLIDRVLRAGIPHFDNDFRFEIQVPFSAESYFIRSILCLPLIYRGESVGVIEILNKAGGGFTDEDVGLMEVLMKPLTVAISTMRIFDNAERLTVTDDLTKLYNYRYLMQYLEAEVRRCMRYKKKVSLLFIDVDGFKQVNDTYGHLVGSRALAEIGQVLRRILRETDVVGRYGGDEFVVVLPETPLNGALVIAERIRKKVEDYEFVAKDQSVHLTISLGVANCPKHTLTAEGLIKKADAAMYRAKELSKNSVKVAV